MIHCKSLRRQAAPAVATRCQISEANTPARPRPICPSKWRKCPAQTPTGTRSSRPSRAPAPRPSRKRTATRSVTSPWAGEVTSPPASAAHLSLGAMILVFRHDGGWRRRPPGAAVPWPRARVIRAGRPAPAAVRRSAEGGGGPRSARSVVRVRWG